MRRVLLGVLVGPLALRTLSGKLGGLAVCGILTVVTQVGGLAIWPVWAGLFEGTRRYPPRIRWPARFVGLLAVYLGLTQVVLPPIARRTGRVRLPATASASTPVGPLWWGYVLLNRNYVRPYAADALLAAALRTSAAHPGTVVRYLDAGFPFPWPPLLPHLSHADGQRIDVAFLFADDGHPVDRARSPIGYWGYARESSPRCGSKTWDLRWDLDLLQPLWPALELDVGRNRTFFREIAQENRVCSILLEPTLHDLLRAPKLRANGCGVARHDDHAHLTIRRSCRR